MNGLVESLLDLDGGVDEMETAPRRFDLIGHATAADGVVVCDDAGVLSAEDGGEVGVGIEMTPGGGGSAGGRANCLAYRGSLRKRVARWQVWIL